MVCKVCISVQHYTKYRIGKIEQFKFCEGCLIRKSKDDFFMPDFIIRHVNMSKILWQM